LSFFSYMIELRKKELVMKRKVLVVLALLIGFGMLFPSGGGKVTSLILQGKKAFDNGRPEAAVKALEEAIMEIRNSGKLGVKNIFLCKNIHGFQMLEAKAEDVLRGGEPLLLYFEPANYMVKKEKGRYFVWLTEDARLMNEKGKVLLERKDWTSLHNGFLSPVIPVYFTNRITNIPKGEYTFEITINDRLKSTFFTKVFKFSVE